LSGQIEVASPAVAVSVYGHDKAVTIDTRTGEPFTGVANMTTNNMVTKQPKRGKKTKNKKDVIFGNHGLFLCSKVPHFKLKTISKFRIDHFSKR
jgi:hypothetical protein